MPVSIILLWPVRQRVSAIIDSQWESKNSTVVVMLCTGQLTILALQSSEDFWNLLSAPGWHLTDTTAPGWPVKHETEQQQSVQWFSPTVLEQSFAFVRPVPQNRGKALKNFDSVGWARCSIVFVKCFPLKTLSTSLTNWPLAPVVRGWKCSRAGRSRQMCLQQTWCGRARAFGYPLLEGEHVNQGIFPATALAHFVELRILNYKSRLQRTWKV